MTTVGEWMSKALHTVPRETPVRVCLKIMRDNDIRHLPVMDPQGRLIGLISEYEILEAVRVGDPLGWAIERLQPTKITVGPDTALTDVVGQMLDAKKDCVVVSDPIGNPEGLFTEKDAMAWALRAMEPWPLVGEVMTPAPLLIAWPDTPSSVALDHMIAHGIRHLVIVEEDGQMRGVVSHRDLVGRTGPVFDWVPDPQIVAREGGDLRESVETMIREGIGSLPVVRGEREAWGIITRVDVLRALLRQQKAR